MSELLERIQREIRERLEASRAAVREHERLEAALHALGGGGSQATRAVTGRVSNASRRRAKPAARAGKPAAARGGAKRAAIAGDAPAAKRRRSRTTAPSGRRSARRATGASASTVVGEPTRAARASSAAKPARKRAARGANRKAVLAVIAAHPGASARELAAGSGVTGGTLYALLRKLADEGTLDKRELAGGQTGYVIPASAPSAAHDAATEPAPTSITPTPDATTQPAADAQAQAASQPEQDRTADG